MPGPVQGVVQFSGLSWVEVPIRVVEQGQVDGVGERDDLERLDSAVQVPGLAVGHELKVRGLAVKFYVHSGASVAG